MSRERLRLAGTGALVGALAALLAIELELSSLVSFWHDERPFVVLVAVACAGLWLLPWGRWATLAGTAVLAMLWLLVCFTPITRPLTRSLIVRDEPRTADAVVVLSSRIQTDGEMSASALARFASGLQDTADGLAPALVLTELRPPNKSYADAARPLLESFAPQLELVTVGPVDNTRDEAVRVGELARERGWHHVIVVTSPTHSRRAAAAFRATGLEVTSLPATETRYDVQTLKRPRDRLAAFGSAIHERLGYFVYARRGWIRD